MLANHRLVGFRNILKRCEAPEILDRSVSRHHILRPTVSFDVLLTNPDQVARRLSRHRPTRPDSGVNEQISVHFDPAGQSGEKSQMRSQIRGLRTIGIKCRFTTIGKPLLHFERIEITAFPVTQCPEHHIFVISIQRNRPRLGQSHDFRDNPPRIRPAVHIISEQDQTIGRGAIIAQRKNFLQLLKLSVHITHHQQPPGTGERFINCLQQCVSPLID